MYYITFTEQFRYFKNGFYKVKFYRNNDFVTDIDKSILMNISSEKYLDIFTSLNTKRNKYKGHDEVSLKMMIKF